MQLLEHEAIRSMETGSSTSRCHVTPSMTACVLQCTSTPFYLPAPCPSALLSICTGGTAVLCSYHALRMTQAGPLYRVGRQVKHTAMINDGGTSTWKAQDSARASAQNSVARKENHFSLTCPRLCMPQTVSAPMQRISIMAVANPPRVQKHENAGFPLASLCVYRAHSKACHARS